VGAGTGAEERDRARNSPGYPLAADVCSAKLGAKLGVNRRDSGVKDCGTGVMQIASIDADRSRHTNATVLENLALGRRKASPGLSSLFAVDVFLFFSFSLSFSFSVL